MAPPTGDVHGPVVASIQPAGSGGAGLMATAANDRQPAETQPGRLAEATGLDVTWAAGTASMGTASRGTTSIGTASMATTTLGRRASEDLATTSPHLADMLSFRGDDSLLRASRLVTVMTCGAVIFSSRSGSAETYALSREVRQISVFVSHNWVVARAKKFWCLAVYFNFVPALCGAAAVMIVINIASYADALPRVGARGRGVCGTLFVAPVFLSILCCGHELRCLFEGPLVFLDKTCIHQVDLTLQQQSIRKLGAYIRKSSRMLVIYTDVYLHKLWTVYEVACFLSLHPIDKLSVIPTHVPSLVVGGTLVAYVTSALHLLLQSTTGLYEVVYLCYVLGAYVLAGVLRRWMRTKIVIQERMATFGVQHCTCFHEPDRQVVYANIVLLMRAIGAVDLSSTDEEARVAFNQLVQQKLPGALIASVGRYGIRYMQVVAMFFCTDLPFMLDGLPAGGNWLTPTRVHYLLQQLLWSFAIFPLGFAFLACWSGLCLHLKGLREMAFLGFGCLCLAVVAAAFDQFIVGPSNLVATALLFVTLSTIAFCLFNLRQLPCWRGGGVATAGNGGQATEAARVDAELQERRGEEAGKDSGDEDPRDNGLTLWKNGDAQDL